MTALELKPCPFCGGTVHTNDGGNSVYGPFWWKVGCPDCGVIFADQKMWDKSRPGMLDPSYPPKHCFAAWNTRAAPSLSAAMELPEVKALVEAARDALSFLMHDIPLENKSANPERGKLLVALAAIEKGTTP